MAFSPSEQSHHRPDGGATPLDARCWRTDSAEDLWCEMNTWLAPRDGASEDGHGVAREAPEDVLCLPSLSSTRPVSTAPPHLTSSE